MVMRLVMRDRCLPQLDVWITCQRLVSALPYIWVPRRRPAKLPAEQGYFLYPKFAALNDHFFDDVYGGVRIGSDAVGCTETEAEDALVARIPVAFRSSLLERHPSSNNSIAP